MNCCCKNYLPFLRWRGGDRESEIQIVQLTMPAVKSSGMSCHLASGLCSSVVTAPACLSREGQCKGFCRRLLVL